MSEQQKPEVGSLSWFDLTIPNAEEVRDFYSKVIGWKSEPVPMEKGKYNDFNMIAPESDLTVTGVCHAQGVNKNLPAQWLLYPKQLHWVLLLIPRLAPMGQFWHRYQLQHNRYL